MDLETTTDELLLEELRKHPGSPTYALANSVGLRGQTALVGRRLRRFEAEGRVRSGVGRYFTTSLGWWAK